MVYPNMKISDLIKIVGEFNDRCLTELLESRLPGSVGGSLPAHWNKDEEPARIILPGSSPLKLNPNWDFVGKLAGKPRSTAATLQPYITIGNPKCCVAVGAVVRETKDKRNADPDLPVVLAVGINYGQGVTTQV